METTRFDLGDLVPRVDQPGGPSRAALLISLVDHVRNDPAFRARFEETPIKAVEQLGLHLFDSEWAGLRGVLDR